MHSNLGLQETLHLKPTSGNNQATLYTCSTTFHSDKTFIIRLIFKVLYSLFLRLCRYNFSGI